jgi:hypothetical protein
MLSRELISLFKAVKKGQLLVLRQILLEAILKSKLKQLEPRLIILY